MIQHQPPYLPQQPSQYMQAPQALPQALPQAPQYMQAPQGFAAPQALPQAPQYMQAPQGFARQVAGYLTGQQGAPAMSPTGPGPAPQGIVPGYAMAATGGFGPLGPAAAGQIQAQVGGQADPWAPKGADIGV